MLSQNIGSVRCNLGEKSCNLFIVHKSTLTLLLHLSPVKPRALNWRFQSPEESYETAFVPQSYVKPRTMNWCYRLAAEF